MLTFLMWATGTTFVLWYAWVNYRGYAGIGPVPLGYEIRRDVTNYGVYVGYVVYSEDTKIASFPDDHIPVFGDREKAARRKAVRAAWRHWYGIYSSKEEVK